MIVDILRSMTKKSYHTCFYKTYFCKVQLVCIKLLSLTVATHMNISLVVDRKKMSDSYLNCNTVLDIPYTTFPDLLKQRAKVYSLTMIEQGLHLLSGTYMKRQRRLQKH